MKAKVEYIALAPYAFGRADDPATAVKNAKRFAPRSKLRPGTIAIPVYEVRKFDFVDNLGAIHYKRGGSCKQHSTAKMIVRKK